MADVFISYAHADDEPFSEGTAGWVTAFADRLRKSLSMRKGGGQIKVWMDHRLEPEKQVDSALAARVTNAACIIAVLSPRYLESKWCVKEIETFVQRAGEDSERVFLVELAPTSREEWPRGIRNLSTRQFWTQAFDDPAAIPLGWPVADPAGDRPYWRALNELSHFVSARLQTATSEAEEQSSHCIWLAEPTDHVLESWEHLAGSLRQQGYRVVPAAPGLYPTASEKEYLAAVEADIALADGLVQLLGPHPGRRPAWSEAPYTLLQAEAARVATRSRPHGYSVWRSPDVRLEDVANSAYAELLTGAATGGLEDFQRHVLSRIAPKATQSPASAAAGPAQAPASDQLTICVSADAPDRELGQRVRDMLFTLGVDANLAPEPAPDQSPAQWRQDYEAVLGESHGLVIVYGSTPPSWVQAQVQSARKLLARTRRGIWGALLDAPPGQQPDHGVRSHNVVMLDCRGGIAPEPLARFLTLLRSAGSNDGVVHA